jgi:ribosomal protein L7Ae-like RNA K-turn-binding protein
VRNSGTPKALSRLGMAMRAGKLATGDEGVMQAIRSGQAKLVLVAADASENAYKKYSDKCFHYGVKLVRRFTRQEIGYSIGKAERVAVAVTDERMAAWIGEELTQSAEVEHIE